MIDELFNLLTIAALLGAALMAGTFFAFSTFIMRALARIPADAGIAAMQSINFAVINPMFLGVFLGTAAACVGVAIGAAMRWRTPGTGYLLAGAVLYIVGTFGVTIICNVPLNNKLAAVSSKDAAATEQWASYVTRWTAWNHVRTAAALAAAGSFALALRRLP